tara:strand:- start:1430 stop:2671 length:1242 start_codon:yes stop_codon:yes gene_type:complete
LKKEDKIAIIGLGYVGLPLAKSFSKYYNVIGYDIDIKRVNDLKKNIDRNIDVDLKDAKIVYTINEKDLKDSNIYIITVPTPVSNENIPDLNCLENATRMVAKYLNKGDIIIYESTVYPGVTEEICVPLIEKNSSLKYNVDFFCGYSPERISPGDKNRHLSNIVKITSGSTPEIASKIDTLYKKIIIAGTYKATSIKVAEASKVVENVQRDVNIALMNEFAIMFDKMKISSSDIFSAAKTKWNFINFSPGLVGGHCIGVDPYYLSFQSMKFGFTPELLLKSREINNSIPKYIALKVMQFINEKKLIKEEAKVLILGYTFKENCADIRNTKVEQIKIELETYSVNVFTYDPYVKLPYTNLEIDPFINNEKYDIIILAVSHNEFRNYTIKDFNRISKEKLVLLDIKGLYKFSTWTL